MNQKEVDDLFAKQMQPFKDQTKTPETKDEKPPEENPPEPPKRKPCGCMRGKELIASNADNQQRNKSRT